MYINHAQMLSNVIQSVRLKQMSYEYLSFLSLREKSPNTDQKKLRIWTLFTQSLFHLLLILDKITHKSGKYQLERSLNALC